MQIEASLQMALDPVTYDLVFGFYDGRHDKSFESVKYMAAIISAKKLDKLIKHRK